MADYFFSDEELALFKVEAGRSFSAARRDLAVTLIGASLPSSISDSWLTIIPWKAICKVKKKHLYLAREANYGINYPSSIFSFTVVLHSSPARIKTQFKMYRINLCYNIAPILNPRCAY